MDDDPNTDGAMVSVDPEDDEPMQIGDEIPYQAPMLIDERRERDHYEDTPVQPMNHRSSSFLVEEEAEEGVRNHQFAAWLAEDHRHDINCKTLPLTMLTWMAFLLCAWCHGNIDETFRMRECLKGAILEVKAKHTVAGIGQSRTSIVSLESVTSVDEMWSWIESGLVPAFGGTPAKPGFVRTFNQVIGSIQLRETRFKDGVCQVGADLASYYRQGCHTPGEISSDDFGTFKPGEKPDSSFVTGYGLGGQLSDYNSKRFFSWLDVRERDDNLELKGKARAAWLRTMKWVDSGTQSLEMTMLLFNSEIQTYGHINIRLSLERGGRIKTDMQVRTLWATRYTKIYHVLADALWFLCIIKFMANSIQKAADNKTAKRCVSRCCVLADEFGGGAWLALDWLGIVVALTLFYLNLSLYLGFDGLAGRVGGLTVPEPMFGNETAALEEAWYARQGSFYAENAGIIDDIESTLWVKNTYKLGMFWYSMIFLVRWFKGFRGQPRIAQITMTLSSAGADLLHFGLISAVLFVNFGIAGHVLFGTEASEWSSITKSIQSTLGMAWGRVDFSTLYEIAPYSATIWLVGYVLGCVMISTNMLLAIIADHYGGVFHANRAGEAGYDVFGQLHAMLYDLWWQGSYVGRYVYRLIWPKLPRKLCFKNPIKAEVSRVEIPYENLYALCHANPLGYASETLLRRAGCDKSTAKHLMKKCEDEVLRHTDEHYPLELLFDEYDENMKQYYFAMDTFSNELRSWYGERSVAANKMIPRQAKLKTMSASIEVAQHIEHHTHHHHRAEHMEGEGHHHHHHRNHGDDNASFHPSNGGSNSRSASAHPSNVPSRANSEFGH